MTCANRPSARVKPPRLPGRGEKKHEAFSASSGDQPAAINCRSPRTSNQPEGRKGEKKGRTRPAASFFDQARPFRGVFPRSRPEGGQDREEARG